MTAAPAASRAQARCTPGWAAAPAQRWDNQTPSQAASQPPASPAATSIGQCTPTATRLRPTVSVSAIKSNRAAIPGMKQSQTPSSTATVTVWPEGKLDLRRAGPIR